MGSPHCAKRWPKFGRRCRISCATIIICIKWPTRSMKQTCYLPAQTSATHPATQRVSADRHSSVPPPLAVAGPGEKSLPTVVTVVVRPFQRSPADAALHLPLLACLLLMHGPAAPRELHRQGSVVACTSPAASANSSTSGWRSFSTKSSICVRLGASLWSV